MYRVFAFKTLTHPFHSSSGASVRHAGLSFVCASPALTVGGALGCTESDGRSVRVEQRVRGPAE